MPSFQHTLLRLSVENMRRTVNMDAAQIPTLRRMLDLSASALYLPSGVQSKGLMLGDIPAEWLIPRQAHPRRVLLFLHGGGYAVGSLTTHRALAAKLALMAGCRALIIDYRLAPEHPFPAALEDAVMAYQWLLTSQGYAAEDVMLAGDSAGGGLCMALQLCLKSLEQPLPAGSVLFSPWVDMTFSGPEVLAHQPTDPVVQADQVQSWAKAYAVDYPLFHPMLSPLFGDLSGLGPILIQASDCEVLTDDAVRLANALVEAHTETHLQLWPGVLHVWQLCWRYVPESLDALVHAAAFMQKQWAKAAERIPQALPLKAAG
jgi:acetyl esterase/lipase